MKHQQFIDDEIDFIDNFQARLGANRLAAVREIIARLGLDYFGIDCSLLADGRLLVFEANAGMRFKSESQEEREFLMRNRKGISEAFSDLLRSKIAAKAKDREGGMPARRKPEQH